MRVDSCTPGNDCLVNAGALLAFTLRTITSGQTIAGVLSIERVQGPIPVSAALEQDGSARFSGALTNGPQGSGGPLVTVTSLHVRADAAAGLTGTLSMTQPYGGRRIAITGTVLSASMRPFTFSEGREFQGTWAGYAFVSDCAGDCWFMSAGSGFDLTLRLTQIGSAVSGELLDIPVTGQVSAGTLTLDGEMHRGLDRFGTGITERRLESFTASVDGLGRMSGQFRFYQRGVREERFEDVPFAGTVTVELISVIRRP